MSVLLSAARTAIFFRETCSQCKDVVLNDGFIVCSSLADRCNFGCEIWIARYEYFALMCDRIVHLTHDDVGTEHADPRILIVSVRWIYFLLPLCRPMLRMDAALQ